MNTQWGFFCQQFRCWCPQAHLLGYVVLKTYRTCVAADALFSTALHQQFLLLFTSFPPSRQGHFQLRMFMDINESEPRLVDPAQLQPPAEWGLRSNLQRSKCPPGTQTSSETATALPVRPGQALATLKIIKNSLCSSINGIKKKNKTVWQANRNVLWPLAILWRWKQCLCHVARLNPDQMLNQ